MRSTLKAESLLFFTLLVATFLGVALLDAALLCAKLLRFVLLSTALLADGTRSSASTTVPPALTALISIALMSSTALVAAACHLVPRAGL